LPFKRPGRDELHTLLILNLHLAADTQ
jgi:hypothetical protein